MSSQLYASLVLCAGWLSGCDAQSSQVESVDVVVVGAGQAGMAAAFQLRNQGYSVQVLEATDHVGGRTRNFDISTGAFDTATDNAFEIGGTWLSPEHSATLGLLEEFDLQVFNGSFVDPETPPDVDDGEFEWWYWGLDYPADQQARLKDKVVYTAKGAIRYRKPSELLASLDPVSVSDLRRAGAEIDKVVAMIDDRCWDVVNVSDTWADIDLYSIGSRYQPFLSTLEGRNILRHSIHDCNAQEPEAIGLLYNSMSFHGCNSAGPGSQYRVRGGTQALPLAIAKSLGASRVSLRSQVRSVTSLAGAVKLVTQTGHAFEAKAAIITGPPPALLGIDFSPPLSGANAQLLQRMPMGASTKFAVVYPDGPWWRELGMQGDIIATALPDELSIPGNTAEARRPLFVNCVDHSPFSREFGVICCFIEGRQNLYFETLPTERQEELFLKFLESSLNSTKARNPRPQFVGHNWIDDPFARGAYTSYIAPGVQSVPEYWKAYRNQEKLPNVFIAGSDYHTGFGNGWIEGAVRSGQRAAESIHARLRSSVEAIVVKV